MAEIKIKHIFRFVEYSIIALWAVLLIYNLVVITSFKNEVTKYVDVQDNVVYIKPWVKSICVGNNCINNVFDLNEIPLLGSNTLYLNQDIVLTFVSTNKIVIQNKITNQIYLTGTINNGTFILQNVPNVTQIGIFTAYSYISLSEYIILYNVQTTLPIGKTVYGLCLKSDSIFCVMDEGPIVLYPQTISSTQLMNEWSNNVISPYWSYTDTLFGARCLPQLFSDDNSTTISFTAYESYVGEITESTTEYVMNIKNSSECISTTLIPTFPSDSLFICFPIDNCIVNEITNKVMISWWPLDSTDNFVYTNQTSLQYIPLGINMDINNKNLLFITCSTNFNINSGL